MRIDVVGARSLACSRCGALAPATRPKKDGAPALPRDWRSTDAGAFCGECWSQTTRLRSLRFSVAEILDRSSAEWAGTLAPLWRAATSLHNWAISQLYLRDDGRDLQPKMGKLPYVYLYPEGRARYPELPARSLVSVLHLAQRRYSAARRDLRYGSVSLPTYRYPQPLPLPDWSVESLSPLVVEVMLAGAHWRLRLKEGPRFRALRAEMGLLVKRGPMTLFTPQLLGLTVYLERQEPTAPGTRTMEIRTPGDAWYVLTDEDGHELSRVCADHLHRLRAAHDRRLDGIRADRRASRDRKLAEKPWSEVSRGYRARIGSIVQESAAHIVAVCGRRRYGVLSWEGPEEGKNFPYFLLRSRLQGLCADNGICFLSADGALAEHK